MPSPLIGGVKHKDLGLLEVPDLSASAQPYQYVESWLYRWDCFLIFCGWSLIGYDSSAKMIGKSVFAHPNNPCNGSSTHSYRILSYHEVHGRNGHTYTGWTGRTRDVACG
jgi:hypothetical protein